MSSLREHVGGGVKVVVRFSAQGVGTLLRAEALDYFARAPGFGAAVFRCKPIFTEGVYFQVFKSLKLLESFC